MPAKKSKKNKSRKQTAGPEKRVLILKGEMEEYAKIMKTLGDRRMTVILPDSVEFLARIPGRFRKRCWMTPGDVVLVSRRSFQDDKLDILYKYNDEEKRKLHKKGEIPPFFLDKDSTEDIIDNFDFSNDQNEIDSDDGISSMIESKDDSIIDDI